MRVMLKSHLDVEAANLAIGDGSIATIFATVFNACRPEATYFLTEGGKRTVYAVFDMASLDQIPALAEPLFQGLGATVEFMPVMSQAELESGLRAYAAARSTLRAERGRRTARRPRCRPAPRRSRRKVGR